MDQIVLCRHTRKFHPQYSIPLDSKCVKVPQLTCRDVSELVMDQIELYRDTKESIMRGRDAVAWEGMSQVTFRLCHV